MICSPAGFAREPTFERSCFLHDVRQNFVVHFDGANGIAGLRLGRRRQRSRFPCRPTGFPYQALEIDSNGRDAFHLFRGAGVDALDARMSVRAGQKDWRTAGLADS